MVCFGGMTESHSDAIWDVNSVLQPVDDPAVPHVRRERRGMARDGWALGFRGASPLSFFLDHRRFFYCVYVRVRVQCAWMVASEVIGSSWAVNSLIAKGAVSGSARAPLGMLLWRLPRQEGLGFVPTLVR